MSAVGSAMGGKSVNMYLEECYTEGIFTAGNLKRALFSNRGTPEGLLEDFYNVFYQLHRLTRYKIVEQNRGGKDAAAKLDADIGAWFSQKMSGSGRRNAAAHISTTGLNLFEEWVSELNKSGIIEVKRQ